MKTGARWAMAAMLAGLLLAGCGGGGSSGNGSNADTASGTATALPAEDGDWTAPIAVSPEFGVQIGWAVLAENIPANALPVHAVDAVYLRAMNLDAAGRALVTYGTYPVEWPGMDFHYHAHFTTAFGAWRAGADAGWTTLDAPGFHVYPDWLTRTFMSIAPDGQPVGASSGPVDRQCAYSYNNFDDSCVRQVDAHALIAPAGAWSPLLATGINLVAAAPVLRADGSGAVVWTDDEGDPRTSLLRIATRPRTDAPWAVAPQTVPLVAPEVGFVGVADLLAADCGDHRLIAVARAGGPSALPEPTPRFWARIWDPRTGRWGDRLALPDNGTVVAPTLRVDARGKAHIAWIDSGSSTRHAVVNCDGAVVESDETIAWPGVSIYRGLVFALTPNDGMAMSVESVDIAEGGVFVNARRSLRWRDARGTWSAPVTVPASGRPTDLAFDRDGNAGAVWSDDAGDISALAWVDQPYAPSGVFILRYRRAAACWDLPLRLSAAPGSEGAVTRNLSPLIAVAPGGKLAVSWLRARRETDATAPRQDHAWAIVDVRWTETR